MDRLTSVSADAGEVISGVIMVRTAKPEKDMEKDDLDHRLYSRK